MPSKGKVLPYLEGRRRHWPKFAGVEMSGYKRQQRHAWEEMSEVDRVDMRIAWGTLLER